MGKNLYEILGVQSGAGHEAIKKAYRNKMRQHHPDTGDSNRAELALAQKAYSILSSPDKRKRYDISLKVVEVVDEPVRNTRINYSGPSPSSSSFYWNAPYASTYYTFSTGSIYAAPYYTTPAKSTISIKIDDVVSKGLAGLSTGQKVYITQIGSVLNGSNIVITVTGPTRPSTSAQFTGTIIHASYGISPGMLPWGEFVIELDI